MGRPRVELEITNKNLGQTANRPRGTTLLVVGLPTGLAGVNYAGKAYGSLDELESDGIDLAFDTANDVILYGHAVDFFAKGQGSLLHILPIRNDQSYSQILTVGNSDYEKITDYITVQNGGIRIMAFGLNPDDTTPTIGQSADVVLGITKLQNLLIFHQNANRPLIGILELRNFTETAGAATDLRSLGENNLVCVMAARDESRLESLPPIADHYAASSFLAGLIASIEVYEPFGKHENGDIGWSKAAFSDGRLISQIGGVVSGTTLDTYHDKAYIFPYIEPQTAGFFFGEDLTCTPATDDLYRVSRVRVIHEAFITAVQSLSRYIEKDMFVDTATGKMRSIDEKELKNTTESAINTVLANGISGLSVEIDSTNFVTTSRVSANLKVVPKNATKWIFGKIGYTKTL